MADYYLILTNAVSRLATDSDQARQELFERARTVFIAQLGRHEIPAFEAMRERIAFETAILRVEAKSKSVRERSPATLTNRLAVLRELSTSENGTVGLVPDGDSGLRKAEICPAPTT
jgi:hypothetical protein